MKRFHSEVVTQATSPVDDDRFTVVPIEATDAISAARRIAEIAARRRYSDDGSVGFLSPCEGAAETGRYLASIGVQYPSDDGIVLKGVTIAIHVWPTD